MSFTTSDLEQMFREYTRRKDEILERETRTGVRDVPARRRLNAHLTYAQELSALTEGQALASHTPDPVPRVC